MDKQRNQRSESVAGTRQEAQTRYRAGVTVMLQHLQTLAALSAPNPAPPRGGNGEQTASPPSNASLLAAMEAERITLRDLGRQVIRTTRTRVAALEGRIEAAALLVLINDWPVAERIWGELVPDLRAPVIELGFLKELWGGRLDQVRVKGQPLAGLVGRIGRIQARVELALFRRHQIVELSNLFERELLPWLSQLDQFLRRLNESE